MFLLVRRIISSYKDYYNTSAILYRNLKNMRNVSRKHIRRVEKGVAVKGGYQLKVGMKKPSQDLCVIYHSLAFQADLCYNRGQENMVA